MWLWALLDPDRLGRRLAAALTAPANELWLSPISVWEALLLAERGRLRLDDAAQVWVAQALRAMPVRDAPLSRAVAIESLTVDLGHDDPADRFIAASARVHGLVLATADQRLLAADDVETLD